MSGDGRIGDEDFAARVRDALSEQTLAPEIADRLAAARRRAVASVDHPIPRAPSTWIPAGALASTLLVVAVLSVAIDRDAAPPLDDDMQLAAAEDLDLLMDLEFVAWLDSDDVDAG